MIEVIIVAALLILLLMVQIFILKLVILGVLFLFAWWGIYLLIKGAPFLPSRRAELEAMYELIKPKSHDLICDLGCGDGRVLKYLSDRGLTGLRGYEYSVPLYLISRLRLGPMVRFGDFWKQDYGDFDVLVCFLSAVAMKDFKKKIWPKLPKGTKVVSNKFKLPGVKETRSRAGVYLYVKK